MVNQQPILIAGPPRSGTTMLAGLLHYHGVWVGRGRTTMYPGTNSNFASENQDIKAIMKKEATNMGYKNWGSILPIKTLTDTSDLKKAVEEFVPQDILWLVKTSWTLIFWEFWNEAYPEAYWILPKRWPSDIIDSMNRHPGMAKHSNVKKREFVTALIARQRLITGSLVKNVHRVDTKHVSQKDTDEIMALFKFLKLEAMEHKVNDWIKPEMMK